MIKEHSLQEYPIPDSFNLENKVLGMLIDNPEYIAMARERLVPTVFANSKNAKLWDLLCDMDSTGQEISMTTVFPQTNSAHYQQYILPNEQGRVTVTTANPLVNSLYALFLKREAYFTGVKMVQEASSEASGASDAINTAKEFSDRIGCIIGKNPSIHVKDAVNEFAEEIQKRKDCIKSGKPLRVTTSFDTLDRMTSGGFANGNLVILAARPSVGKTAVMLQMARTASSVGIPSLVFSLEMTNNELVQRLLCATDMFSSYDLNRGNVDWRMFDDAAGKFCNYPLWFNDKSHELNDIINTIITKNKRGECGVAFIDYLGLIDVSSSKNDLRLQVTEATKRLKGAAKSCGIPVVLLCQLNRDMSKEGREPQLHDLRESGSIEQDADIVLMLSRQNQNPEEYRKLRVFARKNRQGPVGEFNLIGSENLSYFREDNTSSYVCTGGVPDDEDEDEEEPYYNR